MGTSSYPLSTKRIEQSCNLWSKVEHVLHRTTLLQRCNRQLRWSTANTGTASYNQESTDTWPSSSLHDDDVDPNKLIEKGSCTIPYSVRPQNHGHTKVFDIKVRKSEPSKSHEAAQLDSQGMQTKATKIAFSQGHSQEAPIIISKLKLERGMTDVNQRRIHIPTISGSRDLTRRYRAIPATTKEKQPLPKDYPTPHK